MTGGAVANANAMSFCLFYNVKSARSAFVWVKHKNAVTKVKWF